MGRILILDCQTSAGLAFVRSLGRAGHWVAAGSSVGAKAPAAASRYCRAKMKYPSSQSDGEAFVGAIRAIAESERIDLVIPMTDASIHPLSEARGIFPESVRVVLPTVEALANVSDKYRTVQLAQSLGVPVPETVLVRSLDDLGTVSGWEFPIVVKDRFSVRWLGGRGVGGSVSYAVSALDLEEKVAARIVAVGDVLLQRFFPGVGIGFSCLMTEVGPRMPFQWKRIREKDPRGSGSSARRSIPPNAVIRRYGEKMVAAAGFLGLAMVEFKMNEASGAIGVMEINGRPWGSMQLAIHCGLDYPKALVEWLLSGAVPPENQPYTEGITCRWLTADLTHLENLWEGCPAQWPLAYPSLPATVLKVLVPWYPGLRGDHWSLSDPAPGLVDLWRWIRSRRS